ncbi:F0F1 ATP synthase subunit A [Candidatus Woesebacteria bacterium]|nr:F0F1 ATP synthase subunit A [Candidatus Woesebacteria bacterium]
MLHISIKPEILFTLYGLPVTNSLLTGWITVLIMLLIGIYFSLNIDNKNSRVVFFMKFVILQMYNFFKPVLGHLQNSVFPLMMSFFLFILIANWMGLLPGFGSIVIHKNEAAIEKHVAVEDLENIPSKEAEHKEAPTPLFRGATADLNMTLALAISAFVLIQFFGFKELGLGYLKKFFNFLNPINFFIGILELISEFSKILSFAFRLFGNIFAGEVLLTVIAFLIPVLASFPFMMLEIFVGLVQALVFALLTAVFIQSATAKHH